MNSFRAIGVIGLVWLAVGVGCAGAAEGDAKLGEVEAVAPLVQIIPLDQIWAHGIPSTKVMRVGYSKEVAPESPLLHDIRVQYLMSSLRPGPKVAGPSFVVQGTDLVALKKAHAVFAGQAKPEEKFLDSEDLTLVFFSRSFSYSMRLKQVTKSSDCLDIYYELIPLEALMQVDALALIPLRKLAVGKYQVKLHELPLPVEYVTKGYVPLDPEFKEGIVAEPFAFQINKAE